MFTSLPLRPPSPPLSPTPPRATRTYSSNTHQANTISLHFDYIPTSPHQAFFSSSNNILIVVVAHFPTLVVVHSPPPHPSPANSWGRVRSAYIHTSGSKLNRVNQRSTPDREPRCDPFTYRALYTKTGMNTMTLYVCKAERGLS